MPKFVGSFDDVVRTTTGHVVRFHKDEETYVPENDVVIKAVKQAGHQPVTAPKPAAVEKPAPTTARKTAE